MRQEDKTSKEEFYRTVDQRVLGDEEFVGRVIGRVKSGIFGRRRRHGVSLREIARGVGEVFGIALGELRGRGKDSGVMEGRRLFSLVGREYGYRGREIAEYLGKDPAAVTGYLRKEEHLGDKTERLIFFLEGARKNLNN